MADIHQTASDALKEKICSKTILYTFNVTKPFNWYCDSSDCAVGAVLTHQDNCGFDIYSFIYHEHFYSAPSR